MWSMKSATSDQTATINKLLGEEWEPFAVVGGLKKKGKVVFKLYFRKWEGETFDVVLDEQQSGLDVDDLVNRLGEKFYESFRRALSEVPDEIVVVPPEFKVGDKYPPVSPEEDNADEDDENSDEQEREGATEVLGNTKVEIPEDKNPVIEGDGFRVVDDVPTEIKSATARTIAQESSLEKIRKDHGTNVTVFAPGPDGFVKALVENYEYMIGPDGKWAKKDTGAGTNSMVV